MLLCASLVASVAFVAAKASSHSPPGGHTQDPLGGDGISPLTSRCHPSKEVLCINRYAAVMPYHFHRDAHSSPSAAYEDTQISADPSFGASVGAASFLVFDERRGREILGPNPTYEFMFEVTEAVHEAPVFVESVNKLYLSRLAPPTGYLPQLVVDLNAEPPTLSEFLSDPPVYAPNGGTFHNGLIYWGE